MYIIYIKKYSYDTSIPLLQTMLQTCPTKYCGIFSRDYDRAKSLIGSIECDDRILINISVCILRDKIILCFVCYYLREF